VVTFVRGQGAVAGVQLAHAGRKASTVRPWEGGGPLDEARGGWRPVLAPSAIPFDTGHAVPEALTEEGIAEVIGSFRAAVVRAKAAGFQVVEIHAAHGYLIHEFLSPLANRRADRWGGSFDNRIRLLLEIVRAARGVWPDQLPLLVRISVTDWWAEARGGWEIDDSVELARRLRAEGVDLVDCSSGGVVPGVRIDAGPGYQTPFAARIRAEAQIATAAIGLITSAAQAEHVLRAGQADLVFLARQFLRDPYFPLHAGTELGAEAPWPPQYLRARPGP
jgi:2,4-dienoyl-CoA reductase-like NADH-dependent reductase (Old Yellow Enzyme family)